MNKFKVGDKVVAKHNQYAGGGRIEEGYVGIVTHVDGGAIAVDNMRTNKVCVMAESAFDLVAEAKEIKRKIPDGAKIVFVKDCKVTDNYKIGDKATIENICNEGEQCEHYEITLASGKVTWAEEHEFRVIRKWLKATEKRIAQLEIGDTVKLRGRGKAKVVDIDRNDVEACTYASPGHWTDIYGKSNVQSEDSDIVKIRNKEYVA